MLPLGTGQLRRISAGYIITKCCNVKRLCLIDIDIIKLCEILKLKMLKFRYFSEFRESITEIEVGK